MHFEERLMQRILNAECLFLPFFLQKKSFEIRKLPETLIHSVQNCLLRQKLSKKNVSLKHGGFHSHYSCITYLLKAYFVPKRPKITQSYFETTFIKFLIFKVLL